MDDLPRPSFTLIGGRLFNFMAKRFTETKIWDDPWYQELPLTWKIVWKYLCDKADEAGIWKTNFKLGDFQIGQKIKWEEANKYLNKGKIRIDFNKDAWVIKDFIVFQYGDKIFTSEHGFHKKIRRMIAEYPQNTLSDRVSNTLQEEEEVMVEVKEKVIKGVVGGFDFELLWSKYPQKLGKTDALRHFKVTVKTQEDYDSLIKALNNYLDHCKNIEPKYIKHGSSWFNQWKDWIDYKEPQGDKNGECKEASGKSIERDRRTQQLTSLARKV